MGKTRQKNIYEALLRFFLSKQAEKPSRIFHPELDVYQTAKNESELRKAAVLLPITRPEDGSGSHLVLTVRSENLKSHAGQISLPGGTQEEQDEDSIATALRESEEEIGLASNHVEVICRLGELVHPSGFLITPIVGIINKNLNFVAQPQEVADIFQAPLELILDVTAYQKFTVPFEGKDRTVLEIHFEDYRIWGATAAILFHLANEIKNYENYSD